MFDNDAQLVLCYEQYKDVFLIFFPSFEFYRR